MPCYTVLTLTYFITEDGDGITYLHMRKHFKQTWECLYVVTMAVHSKVNLPCPTLLRAQQLLLVKIQKLMCRGSREETDSLRGLRVRQWLHFICQKHNGTKCSQA